MTTTFRTLSRRPADDSVTGEPDTLCPTASTAPSATPGAALAPSRHPRTPHAVFSGRNDMASQLDRDWATLRTHRPSIRAVQSWSPLLPHDVASTTDRITDLQTIIDATQRHHDHSAADRANRLLVGLVDLNRSESLDHMDRELAGRIVVQRLLPGLIAGSVRHRSRCDQPDIVAEAVGALWIALDRYDTVRRPRHVASGLISDSIFIAFRRRARTRGASEEVTEPNSFDDHPHQTHRPALVEFADVVRVASASGIAIDDLDLLRRLVSCDSPGRVARELDITPRTLRNRRDRVVAEVRRTLEIAA